MGWVYLVIGILALLGAVMAAAAWFLGMVTAAATFFVIWLGFRAHFSAADVMATVATVTFDRGRFLFSIDDQALSGLVRRYYPSQVVYSISLIVTVLVIIHLLGNPRLSDGDRAFTIVGAVIAPLIVLWFDVWLNPTERLQKHGRSVLGRKLARLNAAAAQYPDLEKVTGEIHHMCDDLGIALDVSPTEAAATEIRSRTHQLLRDPSLARSIVASCITRGNADIEGLRSSASLVERVAAEHRRIAPLVFGTGSPSYLQSLDFVLVTLHQAKSQLLSRREWHSFSTVASDLLAQLTELERTAIEMRESGRPTAEEDELDAYKTLNVPRGASLDQIKRVYYALVQIYHEARDTHDPEKLKRINAAYTQICRELGGRA